MMTATAKQSAAAEKQLIKAREQTALAAYSMAAIDTGDELDIDSYSIPRIAVLEKMSPEVDEAKAEYIEGAKPGMLCNAVMGELYTDGLLVVPVKRRDVFLEWNPRPPAGPGGFVAEHNLIDGKAILKQCTRNEKGYDITPNGTELHNPLEFYVLYSDDQGQSWNKAIIAMNRTRRKEGRNWNSRIDAFSRGGQIMSQLTQVYELLTARREKDGNVSYVFKIGKGQFLPELLDNADEVINDAKMFLAQINSGKAKVDREAEAGTTVDNETEDF